MQPTRSGSGALRPPLLVKARGALGERELRIIAARSHKTQLLIRFDEVASDALDGLVGSELYGARDDVALEEGEYFDDDLLGCAVFEGGVELGKVVEVLHYPGQDMLAVGARRALIPLVSAFIRRIDVAAKRIEVELPEGLID